VKFAFCIKSAGAARVQGVEMDANLRVNDALRLTAAVGYNHARYTRSRVRTAMPDKASHEAASMDFRT
jgi:outer membrane receptor protein involved in Fe transport